MVARGQADLPHIVDLIMREIDDDDGRPGNKQVLLRFDSCLPKVVHTGKTTEIDPRSGEAKRNRRGKRPSRDAIRKELERKRELIDVLEFGHVRLAYDGDRIKFTAVELKYRPEEEHV